MNDWYALHVRSQRELATAEDLRSEGHTVFVPTETVIRHARNAKGSTTPRSVIRPLVTSYVFADTPWHEHKDVFGCIRVGEQPYRIPHASMLPLFEASGRERHEGQRHMPLTIGQVVRLEGTAYDGMPVTVSRLVGKKVQVVVQIFGGDRLTTVGRDAIAA